MHQDDMKQPDTKIWVRESKCKVPEVAASLTYEKQNDVQFRV